MDYPAPWVEIKNGKLDLSNAYATGIGEFDKFAVKYAYAQFAPGAERGGGAREDRRGRRRARACSTSHDSDARPLGSAHPLGQPVGQRRRMPSRR